MREICGGDSGAVIAHADLDVSAAKARTQVDPGATRRVFKRVVQEVLTNLANLERICEHPADGGVDRNRNDIFARAGPPANVINEARQKVGQGRGFAAQAGIDGFKAGKGQQIIEERVQPLGVSLDGVKKPVAVLNRHVAVPVD